MKFRSKLTLSDGRKIYCTFGSGYQLSAADKEVKATLDRIVKFGAYSPALTLFVMGNAPPDFVRISGYELEPECSPIDIAAFVLGGTRPFFN
jgi:hypothetical protein